MSDAFEDDRTVVRTMPGVAGPGPASTATDGPDDGDTTQGLRAGLRMGDFEILRRIGDGGFSIVYLAREESLDRQVALKEYMPSSIATRSDATQVVVRSERHRDAFDAGMRSFINEAKLLARFDHPSLVKVHRFWEANGTAYMVMPFYEGVTLKQAIKALPQPPDERWLRALLGQLLDALAVIHAERCFHRDIAPDNILLSGRDALPVLLDFGAARRVIGDMTEALTVILKQGYAPIEQYAELPGLKQGTWTDVYALAAVVHWIITGKTPPLSIGRSVKETYRPLAEAAAGRYSPQFLQAIDRALGVLPTERTQTVEAFRTDLGLVAHAPRAAMQHGEAPRGEVPPKRSRVAIAVSAAVVCLAVVGVAWWARSSPSSVPSSAPSSVAPPTPAADRPTPREPVKPPVADVPAPRRDERAAPIETAPAARPEVAPPPARSTPPGEAPVTTAADVPPATRPAKKTAPSDPASARKAPTRAVAVAPSTGRQDDSKAESKAECGRILMSQSSGVDSPALAERYRALGCR